MSEIEYTYYGFECCVGAFFEMPTSDARGLLPPSLEPLELMHERSVLMITAFRFAESMVGAYEEVVLAVAVPPRVESGRPLPKGAFFPFMVGTSTEAARLHAIERWHLPHYMKDLDIDFARGDGEIVVSVADAGKPVLELAVTEHQFEASKNMYNAFTINGADRFKVNIFMEGPHSEHEAERGSLTLHEHPMVEGLTLDDVNMVPFREQWYGEGLQTFEMLESI